MRAETAAALTPRVRQAFWLELRSEQSEHRNTSKSALNGDSSYEGSGFNLLYLIPILIGALLLLAVVVWLVVAKCCRRKRRMKRCESALLPIIDPSALLSPGSRNYEQEEKERNPDEQEQVQERSQGQQQQQATIQERDSSDVGTWRASESQRGSSVHALESFRTSVTRTPDEHASRQLYRRLHSDANVSGYRLAFHKIVFERTLSTRTSSSASSSSSLVTWLCQYEGEEIAVKVLQQQQQQPPPASVAVKRLKTASSSGATTTTADDDLSSTDERYDDLRRLVDEVQLTASLEHPNIVRFLGVAWDSMAVDSLCFITEYLSNGNLQEHLAANNSSRGLQWDRRKLGFAIGVARALQYLHSRKPPPANVSDASTAAGSGSAVILHRDVRAKNVAISHAGEPKLVNIGAKHEGYNDPELVARGDGNAFWTSPEVLSGRAYSEKADVYAFGVLLSEIDTSGKAPYSESIESEQQQQLRPFQVLNQVAAGKLRPAFTAKCPARIREIAAMCLCSDPAQRLSAATLTQLLESYDNNLAQQ